MLRHAVVWAAIVLAGCSVQVVTATPSVSVDEAREQVHERGSGGDWPKPDEGFFIIAVGSAQPDWDVASSDVLDHGYLGCHALGSGDEAIDRWIGQTRDDGWTLEQAGDVLSAAVASLCPWHMATLDEMTGG